MKHHRKLLALSVIAAVGAIGSISATALAGRRQTRNVYISTSNGITSASGQMGGARNSSDQNQWIACWHHVSTPNGGYDLVGCFAYDANNVFASCYSEDWRVTNAVANTASDAQVLFDADANGQCVYVSLTADSGAPPKAP
jgi:hypothetical protein